MSNNLSDIKSGLLMRPEHRETKAKTETEIETETETKDLLWDRDQNLRDRDQFSQVNCMWKWHKSVCFIFYYPHEVNDEPEMDFAFKIISK